MCADFLRQIVSGPKKRYQEDGYNLDLTYITNRIIAMAYPAQGFQKLYRNSIDQVAEMLDKKHGKNYMIINVSGREIQSTKLLNIKYFYWQDHQTPEFHTLFLICELMQSYLMHSAERVCVVHCKHGKGRTGTLICCFLLFSGYMKTAQQALKFYAKKRYEVDGYGVTQPCQKSYVYNFQKILNSKRKYPDVICISKIRVRGQHRLHQPYFKLIKVQKIGVESKGQHINKTTVMFSTKGINAPVCQYDKQNQQLIQLKQFKYVVGDCIFQIKHSPLVGKNLASSYLFNTGFIDNPQQIIQITIDDLSPLSSVKSGNFSPGFNIVIHYKKICGCKAQQPFQNRCERCKGYLKQQRQKWDTISRVRDNSPKVNPIWLIQGQIEDPQKTRHTH